MSFNSKHVYFKIFLLAAMMYNFSNLLFPLLINAIDISATSGIVMERDTSRVLYEKDARTKRSMASTTKIMTGLVAIESGNLDSIVKTSHRAAGIEGSSIWLSVGETQKLEDLVYGLLLSSGNDAAIAIAEHVGGTYDDFIKMMNRKAIEIGAFDTSFENPHGLDGPNHYTTAFDLALITCYALRNEKFANIVKTHKKKIPWEGHEWNRSLNNHNKLLNMYNGCDGVKTGYTKKSGRCLVSSATKEGWQAVAVTLNAPDDWQDHSRMLDFAFDNFSIETIIEKNQYIKTLPVAEGRKDKVQIIADQNLKLPLKGGEREKLITEYQIPDILTAPIKIGQIIGKVDISLDGQSFGSVDLAVNDFVERRDYKISIEKITKSWLRIFSNRIYIF